MVGTTAGHRTRTEEIDMTSGRQWLRSTLFTIVVAAVVSLGPAGVTDVAAQKRGGIIRVGIKPSRKAAVMATLSSA